jgi:hypothetical protein
MSALFNWLLEQGLPFVRYLRFRSLKLRELEPYVRDQPPKAGAVLDAIRLYAHAEEGDLREALLAEQSRGLALDEKTFRHSASIATALTVASAATTAVAQLLTSSGWKLAALACTAPAIFYVMIGGLLGYGATRTLQMFGIGMGFTMARNSAGPVMKPYVLAEALACQEAMNLIRGVRNEAAFLSMRNGFFFVALAVLVVLLGVTFATKDDRIEPKIWRTTITRSA